MAAHAAPPHDTTPLEAGLADICVEVSLEHQGDPLGRAAVARAFTDRFLAELSDARSGGEEALPRLYAATVRSRMWWNRASLLALVAVLVAGWFAWSESRWFLLLVPLFVAFGVWASIRALAQVVRRNAIDRLVLARAADAGA